MRISGTTKRAATFLHEFETKGERKRTPNKSYPICRPDLMRNGESMAESELDELGPVDYLVVEFPPGASHFTGEMAAELSKLVDTGTVRVLDLLIVAKDEDGKIEGMEIEDLDQLDELRRAETQLADLLAAEDIVNLAAAMKPGTVAGVLVWENTWAAPFAAAARRSGGQLIATGRIPIQAILAALEADEVTQGG